ncbi:YitT family protein [Chitinophagaceae bacterium LB-8]|uniref:YitT family protein n=1 Tax=Paraflavisolibacter caeni TaxID=2982496 RepID=A0A9X2XP30_9BACT|nr:YitT family protein [Paraflavisolibacter caeni]MCU7550303.1 YitT family protein [Paraflavisolibacter caeni]
MQFEKAYSFVIRKLELELPKNLAFHNAEHTKDVVQAVQHLSKNETFADGEAILLYTAAAFHDSGFLEAYDNHEEQSCELARKFLPNYEFTQPQIEQICSLIMATKLPQTPKDKLAALLCDADLFYLGTDRYFMIAERLYKELRETGLINNREEWKAKQIGFLESHQYFTEQAKTECNEGKVKNLNLLKAGSKKKQKPKSKKRREIRDYISIILGAIIAGFGLKGFLVPNLFFDGGITGVALLVHEIYHFDLALTTILLNLPLIGLGYFVVSHRFAYKTLFSVLLLGACLLLIKYPVITSDKLLISIFGGFFIGLGAGLVLRSGSALDGSEVLALYASRRTSFTIAEFILAINVIIFTFAAFRFGIETSLYSILTYFTASRTIDYVIEGIEAHTGVTIVSGHSETIKHRILNEMGRAITIYKGERGFLPNNFELGKDCDIIFIVVSRLELRKLKTLVFETDSNAFVFANTIREAAGGILSRRQDH